MISAWLRVVRVRFLLASVIAVSAGLALHWSQGGTVGAADAALTIAGVLSLHASVDLLNDYRDYRRGIDARTVRTGMSGGTGVLPDGLLKPAAVYRAGVAFLVIGAAAGAYFAASDGVVIAAILGFAVASVWLYSTRIVDSGLGEAFVALKGALIVVGAHYIQSGQLDAGAALAGAAVGPLSALVLFVASFPDHDADRAGGRRTLVVAAGRARASRLFVLFPAASSAAVIAGAWSGALPAASLACLAVMPLFALPARGLARHHSDVRRLLPHMRSALAVSRAAGAALVAGIAAAALL